MKFKAQNTIFVKHVDYFQSILTTAYIFANFSKLINFTKALNCV